MYIAIVLRIDIRQYYFEKRLFSILLAMADIERILNALTLLNSASALEVFDIRTGKSVDIL